MQFFLSMKFFLWTLAAIVVAVMAATLGPYHFFTGSLAELKSKPGVAIVRRERSYGDCYRNWNAVATVYSTRKPEYELRIAHGMRYWPELFFYAIAVDGSELNLTGTAIQEVQYPDGGDMRRLREARRTKLTHEVNVRLDEMHDHTVRVEVWNGSGAIVGKEEVEFRIVKINCLEIDSL